MSNDRGFQSARWASLSIVVGGLLMAVLWIVYTNVHGPTSFDENRFVLDRGTLFWGLLLGEPPNLLVALGLIILYPLLVTRASRLARVGYTLTMLGLIVPVMIDLFVWSALGPPFFVPVVGIGVILLALASRQNSRLQNLTRSILILVGVFQMLAFLSALIPNAISDQYGGYRLFGLLAYLMTGVVWVLLGVSLWETKTQVAAELTQNKFP